MYTKYRLLGNMVSFWEILSSKCFGCCVLTTLYGTYNTVGRSIASIYDLGGIFTMGRIYWLYTYLPYYSIICSTLDIMIH